MHSACHASCQASPADSCGTASKSGNKIIHPTFPCLLASTQVRSYCPDAYCSCSRSLSSCAFILHVSYLPAVTKLNYPPPPSPTHPFPACSGGGGGGSCCSLQPTQHPGWLAALCTGLFAVWISPPPHTYTHLHPHTHAHTPLNASFTAAAHYICRS